MLISAGLLVSIGILAACGDSEEQPEGNITGETEETEINDEGSTSTGEEETPQNNETEVSEESSDNEAEQIPDESANDTEASSGDIEDQMDLQIGDTATIASTIGTYEITLNSMEYKEEVDGESSDLDIFLLANYTLKNVGEETINTIESINTLETTDLLDASGYSNVAGSYESVDAFEDSDLEPGAEESGEVLFNSYDADVFYIRAVQGLVASGGLKNDVLFTIEKSEVE